MSFSDASFATFRAAGGIAITPFATISGLKTASEDPAFPIGYYSAGGQIAYWTGTAFSPYVSDSGPFNYPDFFTRSVDVPDFQVEKLPEGSATFVNVTQPARPSNMDQGEFYTVL